VQNAEQLDRESNKTRYPRSVYFAPEANVMLRVLQNVLIARVAKCSHAIPMSYNDNGGMNF
jgi:hypothetical protein